MEPVAFGVATRVLCKTGAGAHTSCLVWSHTNAVPALQLSLVALVAFGVANRVLYKMALVPLGDYVFFLAQFQTFGYCLVYFAALGIRYKCAFVHGCISVQWVLMFTRSAALTAFGKRLEPAWHSFLIENECLEESPLEDKCFHGKRRTGAVSKEQLKAAPWKLLAGVGLIEAASQILGFIGASKLPGARVRSRLPRLSDAETSGAAYPGIGFS